MKKKMLNKTQLYRLFFLIICAFYIITRLFRLTAVPSGYNVDELGIAYDSYSLATDHIDRYGYKMPFYLINYGGGMSIMYSYFTAFLMIFTGFSKFIVRLPAVLFGLMFTIFIGLDAKEIFRSAKASLFAAFLAAVCPVFFMAERFALDSPLMPYFWSVALFFLLKAIRSSAKKWYVLAGIFFGLTFYTYALSYIIIPLFFAFTFAGLCIMKFRHIECDRHFFLHFILMGSIAAVIAIPLFLMLLVNNGFIPEIKATYFSIPRLPMYRGSEISPSHIRENLYLIKDLLTNDWLYYSAIPEFQTMYVFSIVLVPLGIAVNVADMVRDLRDRVFSFAFIIPALFLPMAIIIFMLNEPTISRSYGIYLSFVLFDAAALRFIYRHIKKLAAVLVAGYIAAALSFGIFYFSSYTKAYPDILNFGQTELCDAVSHFQSSEAMPEQVTVYVDSSKAYSPELELLLGLKAHAFDWNRSEKTIGRFHYDVSVYSGKGCYIADDDDISLISELTANGLEKADEFAGYSLYK